MVLIKEYQVVLPCSVEEYQVGQLFSVAEASKNNTGGGEGIEVLRNEPYEKEGEKGQYTHKIYHIHSKVPSYIQMFAPEGALVFHEKAWNAYPYCRTIVTNEYMKEDFFIKIETWHKPDLGTSDNPHGLPPEEWEDTEGVPIDIADRSQVDDVDYKEDEDPAVFHSEKTGRGPLGPGWKKELHNSNCPYMTAYKLVTVHFRWWGLQGRVEKFIHKQEKRLFTNFHRQLFCWLDRWVDLSMDDIRRMEEETQRELDKMRYEGSVRGMKAGED
ncbi:phosphatidylinositol transfer protein beta isoform-like isoform X2 [Conger conger]|uniref:phosphatidylinositol transfer protein beta isoform-like isoform X2 n=1 Tax=Conger conger TaxID=82655 RepID=UPI002A5994B5|nr:phosphatidylinositol transfer protein beta isoform-like isoform X2 [Conger conger]